MTLCFPDSVILAGGVGGVFKTTDGGERWTEAGLVQTQVNKLVASDRLVFAGTDRHGLFRSTDSGSDWTQVNSGLPSYVSIIDIAVKDSFIFAATRYDGVFRTTALDGYWQAVNNGIDNRDMRTIIVSNDAIIASAAGASGSGMFRTTDNGQNWVRLDPYPYAWMADAVCKFSDTVFASRFSNSAKVYVSTDNGQTWNLPPGASAPSDIIISLYADQTGLYAGVYNRGTYRSNNSGVSWADVSNGLYNQSPYRVDGDGRSILIGSYDGIHKSSNAGGTWQAKNRGLTNAQVSCMSSVGAYVFAGTQGSGLFRSSDLGRTWTQLSPSVIKPFLADITSVQGSLYILTADWTYGGTVLMSSNLGNTWIERKSGIDAGNLRSVASGGGVLYVSSDYGVFKSLNGGLSWTRMVNGLPNNGRPNVASMAAAGSVIIAANGESRIYRSVDAGESWTTVSVPPGITPPIVKVAVVDAMMFAGCSQVNFLFQSSDMGATWQRLQIPLVNGSVEGVTGNQGEVFVAVSGGGVISNNGDSTWNFLNIGLFNTDIRSIHFAEGRVWAGSWGAGVFRSVDSSEIAPQLTPVSFSLEQNYPNPFNSETTIRFKVPYVSIVSIVVYNVLGQRVATVVNEQLPPGSYNRTWNASDLPSGVYFYRLETGGGTQTIKALLLK